MSRLTQPLKWFGGKYYLAPRLNAIMKSRPHTHYVASYAGGLGDLLEWDGPDRSELVNDINGRLTNFWNVLRIPELFNDFRRQVEAIPMSRNEWESADYTLDGPDIVNRAVSFFVWCRQSYGGNCGSFTAPTRSRLRRGMNGNVSEWIGAVDGLPDVHARLRSLFIENIPAIELIPREDKPGVFQYLDPPYHPDTVSSDDGYEFMMTPEEHASLVSVILAIDNCDIMISGYPHPSYDGRMTRKVGWTRLEYSIPNQASSRRVKEKKLECVWCNFSVDATVALAAGWSFGAGGVDSRPRRG